MSSIDDFRKRILASKEIREKLKKYETNLELNKKINELNGQEYEEYTKQVEALEERKKQEER